MENNKAFVCKIGNFKSIDGADRIIQASVILDNIPITQVVVGKDDYNENDLVVYFDSNLCIEQAVIEAIDKQHENYNKENFVSISRYLAKGNRVKTVKLRNTISDGLVIPVEKFESFLDKKTKSSFNEGFSFNDLGDIHICHKYVPPVKQQSTPGSKKDRKKRKLIHIEDGFFPEHEDTLQLARNIENINLEDIIHISRKYHGTSSRTGYILVDRASLKNKILKFLKIKNNEYNYVYGSRRVVKEIETIKIKEKQHFYSSDIWTKVGKETFKGKLHKGEIIFYEIVGFLPDGNPIQKICGNAYDYGAPPKSCKVLVYRITLTNEDGYTVEYSIEQIKERCKQMSVDFVEEYYHGKAKNLFNINIDDHWHNNFLESLKVEFLEKDAIDCLNKTTADEGIVIRKNTFNFEAFKLKSNRFLERESKDLEDLSSEKIEE